MKTYLIYLSVFHILSDGTSTNVVEIQASSFGTKDVGLTSYQFFNAGLNIVAEFPSSMVVAVVDKSALPA